MYNLTSEVGDIQFRILYKLPGMLRADAGHYLAPSLDDLMRMLRRAENISIDTAELLVVHQQLEDGTVLEVMYHDKELANSKKNVIELRPTNKHKPRIRVPYEPEDVRVLEEVGKALLAAKGRDDAAPEKKPREGRVVTGFNVVAYPARSTDSVEE